MGLKNGTPRRNHTRRSQTTSQDCDCDGEAGLGSQGNLPKDTQESGSRAGIRIGVEGQLVNDYPLPARCLTLVQGRNCQKAFQQGPHIVTVLQSALVGLAGGLQANPLSVALASPMG